MQTPQPRVEEGGVHRRILIYAGLLITLIGARFVPQLGFLPHLYMMLPLLFLTPRELGFGNYRKGVLYGSMLIPLLIVFPPDPSQGVWILNQLSVAVAEEVFFRGYLMQSLGNIRTSLLFSLAHLINFPTLNSLLVFFPSLLFGFAYRRSGSILAPVLLHFSANVIYSSLVKEFPELYRFLQRDLTGSQ